MILRVQHTSEYLYSRPIYLDPHILRLRPRSDGSQRLIRFQQQVMPKPVGRADYTDVEGNAATQAWFENTTTSLLITSEFEVETLRANPFDFLITDSSVMSMPVRYAEGCETFLAPYCQPASYTAELAEYSRRIASESDGSTLDFLRRLCANIHESIDGEVRESGPPQSSERTLERGIGACRDLAILFIDACRIQGLAARFTSGYCDDGSTNGRNRLHAWAEVYLPGGGWRGFDPSAGLAVADRHIPVAASLTASGATPVSGSFWGSDVSTTVKVRVSVQQA